MTYRHHTSAPARRAIGSLVPPIYREGALAPRLFGAFDDAFAPLHTQLDCIDGYFSPATAPRDILDWMLGWMGIELPAAVPEHGRRRALRLGVRLQGLRATRFGLELLITEVLGGYAHITESGGVRCAPHPNTAPGDREPPRILVRAELPPALCTWDMEQLIHEWAPASVDTTVELIAAGETPKGRAG